MDFFEVEYLLQIGALDVLWCDNYKMHFLLRIKKPEGTQETCLTLIFQAAKQTTVCNKKFLQILPRVNINSRIE